MGNKKVNRVLYIYDELLKYKAVNKSWIAEKFRVDDKTIERAIKDLKFYLQTDDYTDQASKIQYKRKIKGYILVKVSMR